MEMNRSFALALFLSLVFHSALLVNWPFYGHLKMDKNKSKDKIEITYLKMKDIKTEAALKKEPEIAAQKSQAQPEFSKPLKMIENRPPSNLQPRQADETLSKQDTQENKKKAVAPEKILPEVAPMAVSKQAVVNKSEAKTSVDMGDIHSVPASYAHAVRARIIKRLDSSDVDGDGDVFMRFIIASDGKLIQLSVVDERSSKKGLLRVRAFEAIKDSAPFPAFPAGVAVKEIVFTCQISFRSK
ncbi:MAG: TonB C-terminal domain-containing protein [Candidatus Omnitrophota bacterium]